MKNVHTDLAVESREMYSESNDVEIEGVSVDIEETENYSITRIEIMNNNGVEKMRKPIGKYITIDIPNLNITDQDLKDEISQALAKEIKGMGYNKENSKILIIGLGNWNVSPDALGPKVVERVLVTRHYFVNYNKEFDETMANVAAMAPGVMGITGIESMDIVKGIVDKIKPDLLIAVDALASRKMNRVSKTIQLADTGISPGSGIGNKRMALNKETLGIPVLAIGIPTVVNAATMVNDTLDLILDSLKEQAEVGKEFYNLLDDLSDDDKYSLIVEVLNPFMGNTIVTPKDIDVTIDDLSIIIANGLNIALHPGIDLKDVNRYLR
ncbi:GPR endopeptidase [Tissierella sp. Yu-01]|uniref:GPR endopeptidase n=1 Tax=Tissierella sp. Yu-01 TaxID=3035694 RepID=UPI00240D1B83|nr:GPR endopeptidase [Tissierella sp. Yu-01]WFA09530.1 GPR endopeptidase [Tissierella sp. Yu-01]